jgi:hypothetical protein
MTDKTIPAPGPAKLKRNAGPDEWLEAAKNCKYLSEHHMKQLCDIVKEFMMEGMCRIFVFFRIQVAHPCRIEYTTSLFTRHNMWRYTRTILRFVGALSSGRWNAE